MLTKKLIIVLLAFISSQLIIAQNLQLVEYHRITTAAQQYKKYMHEIEGKNVAVVANKASIVGNKHLVDFLLEKDIKIEKVFSPEHGFRGDKDAGEKVENNIDSKTNLSIISLYGSHKKPSSDDLKDIQVVIFDLQDVGVRYYTYISTLTYVMEACAENNVKLIVLDRPNPNGFYVDGPVLETENKSFVGMHNIPIIYGMTIGEYAKMVNGEKWLENGVQCELKVVPLKGYHHNMIVKLPVKPSPNLPNWESVYLYPSLCLFEGTVVSIGRGTETPFQVYGHPKLAYGSYVFTPEPNDGSANPKLQGKHCYGQSLVGYAHNYKNNESEINLTWLTEAYRILQIDSTEFFTNYFVKLAGTDKLEKQIKNYVPIEEIRKSWQPDLERFKKIRKKYLIYN